LVADVHFSEPSAPVAVELADKLFMELERRDHIVLISPAGVGPLLRPDIRGTDGGLPSNAGQLDWVPERLTVAFISGLALGVTLFELLGRDTSQREHPTGRFGLHVFSTSSKVHWGRVWGESQAGELLSAIPEIVGDIESAAMFVRARLDVDDTTATARQESRVARAREERATSTVGATKDVAPLEKLREAITEWDGFRRSADFFDAAEYAAEALPSPERDVVLARIEVGRAAVASPSPIAFFRSWVPAPGLVRAGHDREVSQRNRPKAPVKFQDPLAPENTWSGRGRTPRWLEAHEAGGRSREEFRVAGDRPLEVAPAHPEHSLSEGPRDSA